MGHVVACELVYLSTMITKLTHTCTILLAALCLTSCLPEPISNPADGLTVEGMRPLYVDITNEYYRSTEPRDITSLENIVLYRQYILVVDQSKGIHVIDNSDPTMPEAVAFWVLPGIRNFTVADDVLYMPIADKIVAVSISNIESISILSITEEALPSFAGERSPMGYFGSFECVHPDSGVVTSWVQAMITDPKCWR